MGRHFDLIVIGAGSGGVRAGRLASSYGAKVAVIEEYRLGGTCVIRGCVPKKLFVYASRFADQFEVAKSFGWSTGDAEFSWDSLRDNKDKEINRLEGIYGNILDNAGVTLIRDRAELTSGTSVKLKKDGCWRWVYRCRVCRNFRRSGCENNSGLSRAADFARL